MTTPRPPQAVIIGGPNGAGKTSAAPDLLRETASILAFVNADVIAEGLAGFRPDSAAREAGRIMLTRIRELARVRLDLAFESTLSGRSAIGLVAMMRRQGYDVHIFYLWLPSADLAVARVRRRVEAGGHDVPQEVIRRRFRRSLVNFDRVYRTLTSTWRVYDSSLLGERPLIAYGSGSGAPVVVDHAKWTQVQEQLRCKS